MSRVFVARRLPGNPLERLARERDGGLLEAAARLRVVSSYSAGEVKRRA
jgi:hypothetical protein